MALQDSRYISILAQNNHMKKMKLYSSLFVFSILYLLVFTSCDDDPDCDLELPHDEIELVFYNIEDLTQTNYKFELIGALGSDSIYYDNEDSLSNYPMEINPTADDIAFVFLTGISRDTLRLRYNRNLEWVSGKCGPFMEYDELEIVYSTFDSISLINNVIDESVSENIQVYR